MTFTREELRVSRGILTDPKSLQEYEHACPGSAQLILAQYFKQTEVEQQHRHALQNTVVATEAEHGRRLLCQGDRGQWMGFGIAIAGLGAAVYVAILGHPIVAGFIGSVDLLALVSVFIYGRRHQTAPASDKADEQESGEES